MILFRNSGLTMIILWLYGVMGFVSPATAVDGGFASHEGLPDDQALGIRPTQDLIAHPRLPEREGVRVGAANVHAALTSGVEYDTNVFLDDDNEQSDLIYVLNPSIGFEMTPGDLNFSLDYDVSINRFADYDRENHTDHEIRALVVLNMTDIRATVSEFYRRAEERIGIEDVNRLEQQSNYFRAGIGLQEENVDQLAIEAGYTLGIVDYRSDIVIFSGPSGMLTYDDRDRTLHVLDLQTEYGVSSSFGILFELYGGRIEYDSGRVADAWYVEPLTGVRAEFREDFELKLKAGYRYQDYEQALILQTEDFSGFVARGDVRYSYTDDDIATVTFERSIYESTFSNLNYYVANRVGLAFTHLFDSKLAGTIFATYQLNSYPSEVSAGGFAIEREDDFYGAGTAFRYFIREWLSAQIRYEYRERLSNVPGLDYIDHVVAVYGTIGF